MSLRSAPPEIEYGRRVSWPRVVFHVDMDAFFASVEQRDDPRLQGKAVVVGGTGRRGVVSTCSYEARRFGVKSAMPSYAARQLCPHAVFLPPRMSKYTAVSRQVMAILGRFSPLVEPLSVDEAFLDMTGTEALLGKPMDAAWKLQKAVRDELSLSISVGVAATKFVAKIASDLKKPGGIVVCQPGEERAFLAPLAVEKLWGVGPKTSERVRAAGLSTIADVAEQSEAWLVERFGSLGAHIWRLARGEDERVVDVERGRKSIGSERTLEHDIQGKEAVRKELVALVDDVAAQLRAARVRAGGVRLKLKYADFRRVTRETRLESPVADAGSLLRGLDLLLPKADVDRPIRLVGLAAIELIDEGTPMQASLFEAASSDRRLRLETARDKVAQRFGQGALFRGSDLEGSE